MASMTRGSSSGGSARTVKEVVDAVTTIAAKKVADEAPAKDDAMKETTDAAVAKKAANDAVAVEKATKETVALRAVEAETSEKAAKDSVGSGSFPAPAMGAKRVATPGDSTPPAKRFRGFWKPQYAERLCSWCCFFS
jgi:hypothetical protein